MLLSFFWSRLSRVQLNQKEKREMMDTPGNTPDNYLIPLQLFASRYGHAALLDDHGNELPITESMIRSACDEAMDALYSFMPPSRSLQSRGQPVF